MKAPKNHANVKNLIISAIIGGLYRFSSEKDTIEFLASLKDKFVISQKYIRFPNEIALWIKGYELAPGYKGNFVSLTPHKEKDAWHIKCKTLPIEAKFHPQREIPKQKHPNWGHPILRAVKKKKSYENTEQANKELMQLQEEFPQAAIPAVNKLYIMIYEKEDKGSGVKKYVLEIKAAEDGKPYIDYKLNTPKPKFIQAEKPEGAQGKFTAQVLQKRARKKK